MMLMSENSKLVAGHVNCISHLVLKIPKTGGNLEHTMANIVLFF